MPVSAGSVSWSANRERVGAGWLLETKSRSAAAVVKRSGVAEISRACSVRSCRVSAIAWPIELALIPNSSDRTFWEQTWRR